MYTSTSTVTGNATPCRTLPFNKQQSPIHQQILLQQQQRKAKDCIFWGFVNLLLLSLLTIDYVTVCHFSSLLWKYSEFTLILIFTVNCAYYVYKYIDLNPRQKTSQTIRNNSKINTSQDLSTSEYQNMVTNSFSKTPMDLSASSWLTNTSLDGSQNMRRSNWSFQSPVSQENGSPKYKSTPVAVNNLSNKELRDEKSITEYIREYEALESNQSLPPAEKPNNLLSYFWNHPSTKINKDSSSLLRHCQYQLSTPSSASSSPKSDDKGSPMTKNSQGLDTWRRLNVDSVALTQWNENLRVWISQTILCRLIKEIESIDKSLHMQGITDVTIGNVGLDRLRKTAQGPILQSIPNLPTIVPFLELHSNQEYLVKRIRELSRGGCMSEYKWNGGSSYNGKEWDISLPTDASIIMHLTASYLDTQLLPSPSKPDVKPFTGFHYIKANEKIPEITDKTLAIHEVSVNPPHYRVIIGLESYEMVKGFNNLFHSILLFLYYVNKREHGMLGRINLGRSGVNMLWIIQSN